MLCLHITIYSYKIFQELFYGFYGINKQTEGKHNEIPGNGLIILHPWGVAMLNMSWLRKLELKLGTYLALRTDWKL